MESEQSLSEEEKTLVATFVNDARAYCEFIDSFRQGNAIKPYEQLLRLLSNLAMSGNSIPFVIVSNSRDSIRYEFDKRQLISSEIADAVAPASEQLMLKYTDMEELYTGALMLFDDLSDIYIDLHIGLDCYAIGDQNHILEAIWDWRFGYEHHWGSHLMRALKTVHEIRYEFHFD